MARNLDIPIRQESCLFEVISGFSADFHFNGKAKIVFRGLSIEPIFAEGCHFYILYLSAERNVLHENIASGITSNVSQVSAESVASNQFGVRIATTISFTLDAVLGAESVTVIFAKSSAQPLFVRRDMVRLEQTNSKDHIVPYSLMLKVSAAAQPRCLSHVAPGRTVFRSRSCIGMKGLIFAVTALDTRGRRTTNDIGLMAKLSSLNAHAIVIPRARRLERPEYFNKEIQLPPNTAYLASSIRPICADLECYYDIMGFRVMRYRHSVGMPSGIALFEQISLNIHQEALARSREDFLSLMQGD